MWSLPTFFYLYVSWHLNPNLIIIPFSGSQVVLQLCKVIPWGKLREGYMAVGVGAVLQSGKKSV